MRSDNGTGNGHGVGEDVQDMALAVSGGTDLAVRDNEEMQSLLWMEADVESGLGQIQRGMELMADGIVRVSVYLATIRAEGLYRLRGDVTFEQYVTTRFGLNARTLRTYMKSYENLGQQGDLYGRLLRDMGVKRTYALSIIRDMAPDVFAEFQAQPVAQQQAMREQDLQGIIAQLKVERARMEKDRADLTSAVTRLQMELAAERGSKQRLEELEAKHRNEVGGFIRERDAAQRGWVQEEAETRKLAGHLAQVKTEQSRLEQLLAAYRAEQEQSGAAGAAPRDAEPDPAAAHAADPGGVHVTTLAVPCDVRSLTVDLDAIVKKLDPLKTMDPASMTRDEQRNLMKALGRLARSVQELGVMAAQEGGG